jgi:surfactin synthase thioesterase subunit
MISIPSLSPTDGRIMKIGPNKWTLTFEPRPDARIRLLCFHHAGGGAYGYRSWVGRLRADIELVAVQLPGRENRYSEPALESADDILTGLIDAVGGSLAPYAVFGHSFGAILGYLLACRAQRTGELSSPTHLFLSGARPPIPNAEKPAEAQPLSDEALIRRLARLGGTPQAVLDDPKLLRAFLPALRADFQVLERHLPDHEAPLAMPFTLFRGADDRTIRPQDLAEWRGRSSAEVDDHALPGAHFYSSAGQAQVLAIINRTLAAQTIP